MTEFQKFIVKNLTNIGSEEMFRKFKEYYPALDKKQLKEEYNKQVNEVFFNQLRK